MGSGPSSGSGAGVSPSDIEEETFDPQFDEDVGEKIDYEQKDMIKLLTPVKPDLGVVRCAITQPKVSDDWRRIAILTTNVMINDKPCKILIDSGSYVNAISRNTVNRTGLRSIQHPKTYKVSWIDTTSLSITEQCQVPLQLAGYKYKI